MTDTTTNVPRELLEELRDAANESMNATTRQHQIDHFAGLIAKADALLSFQSPAGVDGLGNTAKLLLPALRQYMHNDGSGLLAGYDLETTQAIIDRLRGEVDRYRAVLDGAKYPNLDKLLSFSVEDCRFLGETVASMTISVQSERDQQAQRIGELEGLLRSCLPALSDGGCAALANRIAAALSAGKEWE